MRIAAAPAPTASLECATIFGPILGALGARLGAGWYLEATRISDGTSMLLVMAAADELDVTVTVTETSSGSVIEELQDDRLSLMGTCQTLDQVSSLIIRHVFQMPARLGFAFSIHSAAA